MKVQTEDNGKERVKSQCCQQTALPHERCRCTHPTVQKVKPFLPCASRPTTYERSNRTRDPVDNGQIPSDLGLVNREVGAGGTLGTQIVQQIQILLLAQLGSLGVGRGETSSNGARRAMLLVVELALKAVGIAVRKPRRETEAEAPRARLSERRGRVANIFA